MKTSQIGKFIVGRTDARFKMHNYYSHYIEVAEGAPFTLLWQVGDWARDIWGYSYWVDNNRKSVGSWNRHNTWATQYIRRGNKRRIYLKGDEELTQFILRWSAE